MEEKRILTKREVFGEEHLLDDGYIYYSDNTCVKVDGDNITYYKIKNNFDVEIPIYKWKKIIHREDGPAMIVNDVKYYYKDDKLHREDGPAIVGYNIVEFYKNGELFRENNLPYSYSRGSIQPYTFRQSLIIISPNRKDIFYDNNKINLEEIYMEEYNIPVLEFPFDKNYENYKPNFTFKLGEYELKISEQNSNNKYLYNEIQGLFGKITYFDEKYYIFDFNNNEKFSMDYYGRSTIPYSPEVFYLNGKIKKKYDILYEHLENNIVRQTLNLVDYKIIKTNNTYDVIEYGKRVGWFKKKSLIRKYKKYFEN